MIKLLLITIIFLLQGCHNLEHTINREGYEIRKKYELEDSKYNKPSNDDVNEQNEQRMIEQCEREEREIRKCENDWSEYNSCMSNSRTGVIYGNQDTSYLCNQPRYNCNRISRECNEPVKPNYFRLLK